MPEIFDDLTRLRFIFGTGSSSDSPDDHAHSSRREFIRSQDLLALHVGKGTGRVLSAYEAYRAFGLDKLEKAVEDGSVLLPGTLDEPAASIREQRERLGLSVEDVAKFPGITVEDVERAEDPDVHSDIRVLGRIAVALNLDDKVLSAKRGAGADERLAVRLRALTGRGHSFTPRTVLALDEAAWVIRTQHLLQSWLFEEDGHDARKSFVPSSNYGSHGQPNWRQAHSLAHRTRAILGLSDSEPVTELRRLCERELSIPVVQLELPDAIAGVTLRIGEQRGVALNLSGPNENVWIRRATLAHELAHLLWDPDEELEAVRVDRYVELMSSDQIVNRVEQRANAFAAEFLAPQAAALREFESAGTRSAGLRRVMENFGVSFTVARYQIYNALNRRIDLPDLTVQNLHPTQEWRARETWTADYFPIADTPIARRGDFAAAVATAEKDGYISKDTAAEYLMCSQATYEARRDDILALFPDWN
jgi:Zn-dependent peptidase ImmA (M78 family)/transcriptional regulator with XRE-family HTH domain